MRDSKDALEIQAKEKLQEIDRITREIESTIMSRYLDGSLNYRTL